jgi:hypothetical protein
MMYSMDLFYNFSVLDPLGHGLCTKVIRNALKTILLPFVYSYFISFAASFQHIKSTKYTMLFGMVSPIVYIIIIMFSILYGMNCVEILT